MDMISFRCTGCKQTLKVKAEYAGRKTKCKKCGTSLTIPNRDGEQEKPAAAPKPAAVAEEEESGGAYRFADEPEPTRMEETAKPKKKDQPKIIRKVKKKSVQFAEQWQKFRITLILAAAAMGCWGIMWVLRITVFILGQFSETSYSALVGQANSSAGMSRLVIMLGLEAGLENMNLAQTLGIIEYVMALVGGGLFLTGYFFCLGVPPRYGTRGQAITLLILGGTNLLSTLLFKLLPMSGAMDFVMIPLLGPEVTINEASIERLIPLHAFWAASGFWEMFAAIIIQAAFFAEPILIAIFLRTVGLSMKDDEWLEPKAEVVMRLGFGQFFALLSFYMLSMVGTSAVLRLAVIVFYLLWQGFFLGFIIYFIVIMIKARQRVTYVLGLEEEEEE
jgi:DNA-directed RNA polymerase subunit RPC12/RpoP